jgi:VanZ family protein
VVVTLAWAGAIFVLSSRSHVAVTDDPLWDLLTRKAAHVLVFAVLAYLVAWTARSLRLPHPALIGLSLAVLYGAVDEFHQGFVVGRSALLADVLIDSVGALGGAGVWWWRDRQRRSAAPRAEAAGR